LLQRSSGKGLYCLCQSSFNLDIFVKNLSLLQFIVSIRLSFPRSALFTLYNDLFFLNCLWDNFRFYGLKTFYRRVLSRRIVLSLDLIIALLFSLEHFIPRHVNRKVFLKLYTLNFTLFRILAAALNRV
jgi:hypothetical protein